MTDQQHPITPPPELADKWTAMLEYCDDVDIFTDVARWGADQELEACITWVAIESLEAAKELRAARRPKSPSLKEQALEELESIMDELHEATDSAFTASAIRRALEQLDD